MNGLRNKYFSANIVFCHNVEADHTKIATTEIFFDFIDLKQKSRFGRSGLILLQSLALYFAIIYSW